MKTYVTNLPNGSFLGLCICEKADGLSAIRQYRGKVRELWGYQAGGFLLGLVHQEDGIYTLIYGSVPLVEKDNLVAVGRNEFNVRALLDDFVEYSGLKISDLPEPYLSALAETLIGEKVPSLLRQAERDKSILVTRLF